MCSAKAGMRETKINELINKKKEIYEKDSRIVVSSVDELIKVSEEPKEENETQIPEKEIEVE